ncbi:hypothetical protein BH09CHL1_BH09CHL1_28580 [soil metagenome]
MAITRTQSNETTKTGIAVPTRFVAGLLLVGISWWAAWFGPEVLRSHSFFPLWLGYILTVDAMVAMRSGTSIYQRSRRRFVLLFACSAPLWWGFELANLRIDNWHYSLPHRYTWLQYHSEATIAFSTVLPAILETAELVKTSERVRSLRTFKSTFTGSRAIPICIGLGLMMIASAVLIPKYCFPFLWLGPFFILDPINAFRGQPSLLSQARQGNWRTIVSLAVAGLICGFFWEMWNSRAMPKWTYSVPFVGRPKLFEMPVLGYGGYIPFAFELFAAYHFLASLAPKWLSGTLLGERYGTQLPGEHE